MKTFIKKYIVVLSVCLFIVPIFAHANFLSYPDLELGKTSPFVTQIQKALNTNGFIINPQVGEPGSLGYESDYFGKRTQDALSKFQQTYNINPSTGYFGAKTKTKMNEVMKSFSNTLSSSVLEASKGTLSAANETGCSAGYAKSIEHYGITWYFQDCVK